MAGPETLGTHFTRLRIIEASSGVFAARGKEGTSVQHLLEAAGISRRTFYRYFPNKEAVLAGLYDVACDILLSSIKAAVWRAEGFAAKLAAGIDVFLDFHRSQGALVRLLAEEAMRSESPLAPRRKATHEALIALFEDEARDVLGRPVDRLVYASLIWTLESISVHVLADTPRRAEDFDRARRVMNALAARLLLPGGDAVPLPPAEDPT